MVAGTRRSFLDARLLGKGGQRRAGSLSLSPCLGLESSAAIEPLVPGPQLGARGVLIPRRTLESGRQGCLSRASVLARVTLALAGGLVWP